MLAYDRFHFARIRGGFVDQSLQNRVARILLHRRKWLGRASNNGSCDGSRLVPLRLHLPAMGSVGDNYKCPWCGRNGKGGYAVDGIGYPLCTDGEHACAFTSAHKYSKQSEYFTDALLLRFGKKPDKPAQPIHKVHHWAWKIIAGFIAGED